MVLRPAHLRRTGLTAFIVGTWLTAFNHGDAIASSTLTAGLAIKIALNCLTPFVVANIGLLSRRAS